MTKQKKTEKKETKAKTPIKSKTAKKKTSNLSKMHSCLASKASIAAICFLAGVGITLLIQNYSAKPNEVVYSNNNDMEELLLDPFNSIPLAELNILNRRMEERLNYLDSYFDNFIKIEPSRYSKKAYTAYNEDDDFIYYQINFDGYDKEDISIKTENNQLIFSANISQNNEDEEKSSRQFMSSNFLYSFALPKNIDLENPEISNEDDKITVKFKKKNNNYK